jgi:hypothetical protein
VGGNEGLICQARDIVWMPQGRGEGLLCHVEPR